MQEQIWQVDENDKPIGSIGRDDSRAKGARYRIVRVSVEDRSGAILLQKRTRTKKSYPGCWDTSAGGNISFGESYEEAAQRELKEESGIGGIQLDEVAYFYGEVIDPAGNMMNRFTKLYKAVVPTEVELTPQPDEVEEFKWVTLQELSQIVQSGNVTDGLSQAYDNYYSKLLEAA